MTALKHAPGIGAGALSRRSGHAREQAGYLSRCVIKLLQYELPGPNEGSPQIRHRCCLSNN